jgi:concanavalin A-like lectin/glucanase superfamily protein
MKRLMLVLAIALAVSTATMASEIAISSHANWWPQEVADVEMQEIVDNVTGALVEVFDVNQQDALANWVVAHTGDGKDDLLILCGRVPDSIYPGGNALPDGSIAELFLDDGNTIINTGDYMFYVATVGSNNASAGLENMMDIAAGMWNSADLIVTAEGLEYTPTLPNYYTDRAWSLSQLVGDWYAELILAQNEAGTIIAPAMVRNGYTGGRLGTFFQIADALTDIRGEVISEWINNWYLPIGSSNPYAMREMPKTGTVLTQLTTVLEWKSGDAKAFSGVYFTDSLDDLNNGLVESIVTTETTLATNDIPAYAGGLTPGQTYYWRVDEVGTDGAVYAGDVWSFSILPLTASAPAPADGAVNITTDTTLGWDGGLDAITHTIYMGESFDDVNDATTGGQLVVGDPAFAPVLEEGKTYYWRVDEMAMTMLTHKGDVWSFSTVPVVEISDPSLIGSWTMDEGTGATAVDYSGYGNHGQLIGTVEWANGFNDGAASFDGTYGSYIDIAGRLMSLDGYFGFTIVRHSSNIYRLWVGDGTPDLRSIPSDATYTDTEWHHVAGVREGQTNSLYVDGVLQSAPLDSEFANSTQYFSIGKQYSTGTDRTYIGVVDDVQLYDVALTGDDIAGLIVGDAVFFERFDAYEANTDLHGQGGWKGWAGDAGAGALATDVNDPVGAGAVEILGSSDLVREFEVDGGAVTFTAMQYIPSATTGTQYFILMSAYNDPGVDMEWSVQTMFNLDTGVIDAYTTAGVATIVYDEWVEIKCVIDLDNNTVDDYYNGTLIESRAWSGSGKTTLQAIDLYGAGASSIYYDDIRIQ